MTIAIIVAVALVYLLTVGGFLALLDRMRKLDAQQQDMLLERIQRPESRPVPLTPFDEDIEWNPEEDRTDLGEMAAVGMINPTGLKRDE